MRKFTWKWKISLFLLAGIILLVAAVVFYLWQIRLQKPLEVNMGHMHHMNGARITTLAEEHTSEQAVRSCEGITASVSKAPIREFRLTAAQTVKQLDNAVEDYV
ncbi:hypothetical protein SAMN03159341_11374 [Paenibacillus sp. 1_12]|uniref:hypothetical protein n=1 Tax=Paenibacillus sp. 1_12 TaxID=1566278 RepID=UPI0008E0802D|nr:hypothetical protein [Paenibacillus sp. 1_12]SFL98384.1 hypothetical protein SAMN03159341_11374 [Paenibacillus sp. 1_12]